MGGAQTPEDVSSDLGLMVSDSFLPLQNPYHLPTRQPSPLVLHIELRIPDLYAAVQSRRGPR